MLSKTKSIRNFEVRWLVGYSYTFNKANKSGSIRWICQRRCGGWVSTLPPKAHFPHLTLIEILYIFYNFYIVYFYFYELIILFIDPVLNVYEVLLLTLHFIWLYVVCVFITLSNLLLPILRW